MLHDVADDVIGRVETASGLSAGMITGEIGLIVGDFQAVSEEAFVERAELANAEGLKIRHSIFDRGGEALVGQRPIGGDEAAAFGVEQEQGAEQER